MAAVPVQGSRPQGQSRSPNYSPKQDYWVSKRDHCHQHLRKTFCHPSKQKSQMQLPCRTPGSYPRAGSPATTPVWTPINQHGVPPVAFILGLCSSGDSLLPAVAHLYQGTSHRL
ncbi:hypothetical protein GHT09_014350 [Marmota monax]|uniref:Uncharacterized protein n=1 Tax=Marmota monax TaxID=9995 RepID=A0A834UWV3_MARMO|nr:hypothetical protein GHT09_014350 [Marmota monax]